MADVDLQTTASPILQRWVHPEAILNTWGRLQRSHECQPSRSSLARLCAILRTGKSMFGLTWICPLRLLHAGTRSKLPMLCARRMSSD